MNSFTYQDLKEILKIKDRVIERLLVGGGGAMYDEERKRFEELIEKAKSNLKEK